VLGIDPGGAHTGLCVRVGQNVVGQAVVAAPDVQSPHGMLCSPAYLAVIREQVLDAVERGVDLIAVEGVRRPNPHMNRSNGKSIIDPGPLIATGIVLGAVTELAAFLAIPVEWVPPGKNGSNPLYAYPEHLVSVGERRHGLSRVGGSSLLRHVRSAYDVAGMASSVMVRHVV